MHDFYMGSLCKNQAKGEIGMSENIWGFLHIFSDEGRTHMHDFYGSFTRKNHTMVDT